MSESQDAEPKPHTPLLGESELRQLVSEQLSELRAHLAHIERLSFARAASIAITSLVIFLVLVYLIGISSTSVVDWTIYAAVAIGLLVFTHLFGAFLMRQTLRRKARETTSHYIWKFVGDANSIREAIAEVRALVMGDESDSSKLASKAQKLVAECYSRIATHEKLRSMFTEELTTARGRYDALLSGRVMRTFLTLAAGAFILLQAFDLVFSFFQYTRVDYAHPFSEIYEKYDATLLNALPSFLFSFGGIVLAILVTASLVFMFGTSIAADSNKVIADFQENFESHSIRHDDYYRQFFEAVSVWAEESVIGKRRIGL